MATLKRMDKRLSEVEAWVKNFERGTGPAQTMDNMNWLLSQCRTIGDRAVQADQIMQDQSQALQTNQGILSDFLEKNDLVKDWQGYLAELDAIAKEEQENAVQESETKGVDAREEAQDG